MLLFYLINNVQYYFILPREAGLLPLYSQFNHIKSIIAMCLKVFDWFLLFLKAYLKNSGH